MTTHPFVPKTVTVIGLGSIGLPYARYLAWSGHSVIGYDTDLARLNQLEGQHRFDPNDTRVPVALHVHLRSRPTLTFRSEIPFTEYYLICVPTPSDEAGLNTTAVFEAVDLVLAENPTAFVLIKSTLTVEAVDYLHVKYPESSILVTPEYLREGETEAQLFRATRVVIGAKTDRDFEAARVLLNTHLCPIRKAAVLRVSPREAAYSKILHNAYLATRVAFFNEADSVCHALGLSSKRVIATVCSDPRIGDTYNTPSFGFGGTCLPKDTHYGASLHATVLGWPTLLTSVLTSNKARTRYLAKYLKEKFSGRVLSVGVLNFNPSGRSPKIVDSATEALVRALLRRGLAHTLKVFSPTGEKSPVPNALLDSPQLKIVLRTEDLEDCDVVLSDRKTHLHPELKNLFTRDLS